jgi:hypothetical protein
MMTDLPDVNAGEQKVTVVSVVTTTNLLAPWQQN